MTEYPTKQMRFLGDKDGRLSAPKCPMPSGGKAHARKAHPGWRCADFDGRLTLLADACVPCEIDDSAGLTT